MYAKFVLIVYLKTICEFSADDALCCSNIYCHGRLEGNLCSSFAGIMCV